MTAAGWVLLSIPAVLFAYAYLAYPAVLWALASLRRRGSPVWASDPDRWPRVSISLPAYNEEARIADTLRALLELDYPRDRVQIVVVSDASTDGTDRIVRGFAGRGVELVRLPRRVGKTAAENAAVPRLRGEIVVNTDASIRILPGSLKPLVRAFADPEVGVASGRDVSVGGEGSELNVGETGYVGYEMWIRSLETRLGGIVGASGCFYAIRAGLHGFEIPEALSRDFASVLVARERGYRAVSVDGAVCLVPRTGSLRGEFRRKLRTMARGLDTLWHLRALLNPFRHGAFAWKLASHKLCRWLLPATLPAGLLGLALLAGSSAAAAVALGLVVAAGVVGGVGLAWPEGRGAPRPVALCGYALASSLAGVLAWLQVLRGQRSPLWEPTRRTEGSRG